MAALARDEFGEQINTVTKAADDMRKVWDGLQSIGERVQSLEVRISGLEQSAAACESRKSELAALRRKLGDLEIVVGLKLRGAKKSNGSRKAHSPE